MDRAPGDRAFPFRSHPASPSSNSNANVSTSNLNKASVNMSHSTMNTNNNSAAVRVGSTVAPGYAQFGSTNGLRMRRVASRRRPQGSPGPGNRSLVAVTTTGAAGGGGGVVGDGSGGARSDNSFDGAFGTSPQSGSLLKRHGEISLVSPVYQHHSMDSMVDVASTASPFTQSPVGAFPGGAFPATVSRDSVTMQELMALQQQQQSQLKGVTVIYPQGASPTDPQIRMLDYASMQDALSADEGSANEDRVQVRVEGYYEGGNVNVLIPNDLPPSTLLYVLTASDGRDLMFKLTQYTLQLVICFLKMPSLFSPEVQVFTGPWAERLYKNYNTIRHGRSLFKIGRGLLNFFTVQTVCERMWMRYESAISRQACAVLLPVVTRVEKLLLLAGASPVWGRAMSRQLLHWAQAAELTPDQRRLEESQDFTAMDWRIQERMKVQKGSIYPGALLADDTFTHVAEAERSGNNNNNGTGGNVGAHVSGGSGGSRSPSSTHGGMFQGTAGASFTDWTQHTAMNAMDLSVPRGTAPRFTASLLPGSAAEDNVPLSSPERSTEASPVIARTSSPTGTARSVKDATPPLSSTASDRTDCPTTTTAAAAAPEVEAAKSIDTTPNAASSDKSGSSNNTNNDGTVDVNAGKEAASKSATSKLSPSKEVEASMSSSADDASGSTHHAAMPPFMHGTMPQLTEHDHLPGMTPSKLTANTQPMADSYDGENGDGGRVTLLRPLPRPTHNSSTTDAENSITCDDGFGLQLDSTVHEDTSSMPAMAAANSSREPMSMPDSWRPAMAPTVPPSQSDQFGYGPTHSFADHAGSLPSTATSARLLPPCENTEKSSGNGSNAAPSGTAKEALVSSSECDEMAGSAPAAAAAASAGDAPHNSLRVAAAASAFTGAPRHSKKVCPPFEMAPPLPVNTAVATPGAAVSPLWSPSSSLSAMPKYNGSRQPNEELNESDMSILSSEANSSFHVRPSGTSGAITAWMNELQPASAALPARLRKGVLQFSPLLMTLLGIRNLAAGLRRFLRDATLVSTERFATFTFIEVHRRAITRFINRCWLLVSIIDLILNTVRLLDPGWTKYATARQNIRCRCGCQGDEDPFDTVWRTHGFIARRKTDLFFPPLNLDYGAPFVSAISYMEAADPARLMPACSRCGCLYKELPSEAAVFDSEADVVVSPASPDTPGETVSVSTGLSRSTPAHASLPSETPFVFSVSRPSQAVSDVGESRSRATGAIEREKPRWVQMYEAEKQRIQETRRRNAGTGPSGRRETQKPGSGTTANTEVAGEPADLAPPPPLLTSAGRPLRSPLSRDANDDVFRRAAISDEREDKDMTGILFVPWMMRKFFDYVWLLRVHPNLTATLLLEARYLAEFYLSYKYCFSNYESFRGDAPLNAILHPYGAIAGIVSAAVGLLRVVESAPTS